MFTGKEELGMGYCVADAWSIADILILQRHDDLSSEAGVMLQGASRLEKETKADGLWRGGVTKDAVQWCGSRGEKEGHMFL